MNKYDLTLDFELTEENKKVLDYLKEETEKTYWYRIENEYGEHLDVVDKEKYDLLQQENKQLKENRNKTIEELFVLKDMIYKPETREENFGIQQKISSIIKQLKGEQNE